MSNAALTEPSEQRTSLRQRFLRKNPEDSLPLTITHHRIYILPSKRGWFFIFSLLIMLIASMNYAINLGFALCFLLTGLVASSLLSTYQNLAGIEILSADVEPTFAGDYLCFRLGFQNNRNVYRSGIKIATADKIEDIFSIAPEDSSYSELAIPAPDRGIQQLGRITLSSDYPLGLWYGWSYFHTVCEGIVYPQKEANAPQPPVSKVPSEANNSEHKKLGEDEFSELKIYQPGDPQSRIAWKAAARGQGWYSKSFTEDAGAHRYSFDLSDTRELDSIEQRLSRLTSWIVHAERKGVEYSLSIPGYQSALDNGIEHRNRLLKKLALYGYDSEQ